MNASAGPDYELLRHHLQALETLCDQQQEYQELALAKKEPSTLVELSLFLGQHAESVMQQRPDIQLTVSDGLPEVLSSALST